MTQSPYPQQPTRAYVPPTPPPSNGLGLAGFIVSIVGMVLCLGTLCPIGAAISIPAVFKQPRGFAIAGLLIGVLGTLLWALLWTMYIYLMPSWANSFDLMYAQSDIDNHYYMNNTLPDDATGQQLAGWYDDEWGTAFRYQLVDAQNYEILSAGPDKQFGTADDQAYPYPAPTSYGNMNSWNVSTSQVIDDAHVEIERTFKGEYNCPPWDRVQNLMGQRFTDEWGNPLRYNEGAGRDYELRSAGPDGQLNTSDDIVRQYTLGAEDVDAADPADTPDGVGTPEPAQSGSPAPTPADGA